MTKITKITKITHLSTHRFENWAQLVLNFIQIFQKYVLFKKENGFHCFVSSRREYLSSQRFITRLSRHSLFSSERGKSYTLLKFIDSYVLSDRKWLLFTCLFLLPIFQESKTPKFCFLYKTTRLSRHSFEKWAWSVLKFSCFNRDAQFIRQKMVFVGSSTFIANI